MIAIFFYKFENIIYVNVWDEFYYLRRTKIILQDELKAAVRVLFQILSMNIWELCH